MPARFLTGCRASAFSLTEILVSIVLVGGLLVVALNTVGGAAVARRQMTDAARGQLLAQQLMAEILRQPYIEPVDPPSFGRESSESAGDRAQYDDVDDYDEWSSSPPEYHDGSVLPDLDGWARTVSVAWIDPSDHTTAVGYDSGIKRIDVAVLRNDIPLAEVSAIRSNAGDATVAASGTPVGGSSP